MYESKRLCRRKCGVGAFCCAPSGARFQRVKVPNPPGSGKDIAEGKGVHREVESEGSRMWGNINPRANLWSDGQKSHKRLCMRVSLHHKSKPDNYTESCMINVADRWREGNVWYLGRSVRYALKGVTTVGSGAVRKEIVRNTKGMRKRQGHSIGYGKKETVHSRDFWKRYCIKTTLTERTKELRQTRGRRELTE